MNAIEVLFNVPCPECDAMNEVDDFTEDDAAGGVDVTFPCDDCGEGIEVSFYGIQVKGVS